MSYGTFLFLWSIMQQNQLTINNHSRYFNNCTYVYPVISRRSEGLSLGINLNIDNSCNWKCIYCQVDGLHRGKPDEIDLVQLEYELDMMLNWIINGDFMLLYVSDNMRRFNDICIAGNGEPTLSPSFEQVCQIIVKLRLKYNLSSSVKTILITNGSQVSLSNVQHGIKLLAKYSGEVWFKVDRANIVDIKRINQIDINLDLIKNRLSTVSELCATYIQSCWFNYGKLSPTENEISEFLYFLKSVTSKIRGVLLYSTARQPAQFEGKDITQLTPQFMFNLTEIIKSHGIDVKSYL